MFKNKIFFCDWGFILCSGVFFALLGIILSGTNLCTWQWHLFIAALIIGIITKKISQKIKVNYEEILQTSKTDHEKEIQKRDETIQKRDETIKNLNKKLTNKRNYIICLENGLEDALDKMLKIFSEKLSFKKETEKIDRITLYSFDGSEFWALSRYSENPEYKRKVNGRKYSPKKGAIEIGYKNEFFVTDPLDIPDYLTEKEAYEKCLKENFNFTSSDIKSLKMNSRYFAVMRISVQANWYALLVVESLKPARFEKEFIYDALVKLRTEIMPILKIWSKNIENEAAINIFKKDED